MKIAITGSLGNISKPLAETLIAHGHSVTIISSNGAKLPQIEALCAQAAIGSVTDPTFLQSVFAEADAVYAMIPPNYATQDPVGHYRQVATAYAEALADSDVTKVVHLSSWGADLSQGTGFILGSHYSEKILNEVTGKAITHLRAGYIYYNLYHFIPIIKATGVISSNYGDSDRILMVSPLDIATAAAEALLSANEGIQVRYVASQDVTAAEAAAIVGNAIGKPGLQWKTLSNDELRRNLGASGVPHDVIENTLQLGASIHDGSLRRHFDQSGPHVFGKVRLEDFVKEFAAVYHNA
ncbi:NAD(P)H-binding protein [Dyadobacter sp. 676]|uniref:NAD(P)H-binding protein n=1 Tax=Dyadobacter sp. 676 TaxID=3088362 RepID=A0AAU8FG21_9BACT